METNDNKYFTINKDSWNRRVAIHKDSSFYDVEGFKNGKNVLNNIELHEVGEVKGKSILHLQCHFGLDTLSWARLGAEVTGVDFSDEAIDLANELKEETAIRADFICSNIYDLKDRLHQKFDIVFASYGVIGWLPELDKWANIIHHFTKPGGMFYLAEFHPVVWMFDDNFTKFQYSYFNSGVIETESEGTYADKDATLKYQEFSWNHSLSEVVNALINNGLKIDFLNEHDYSPYDCFANMVKNEEGHFYIRGYEEIFPLVYSIKATKPDE